MLLLLLQEPSEWASERPSQEGQALPPPEWVPVLPEQQEAEPPPPLQPHALLSR
jgi:hypothetical protein